MTAHVEVFLAGGPLLRLSGLGLLFLFALVDGGVAGGLFGVGFDAGILV